MPQLSWNEIRDRAVKFASEWRGETYERGESQTFWTEFLGVFGVDRRRRGAFFEHAIKKLSGNTGFVDLFWPGKLLVEQKSAGRNLEKAGSQAFGYFEAIPSHELPERVVVCDFATLRIFDPETGEKEIEFALENLPKHVKSFGFIIGRASKNIAEEDPVNRQAAESMARLHNRLQEDNYAGRDLELLLVRLVFLMFAEDSGIFDQGVLLDHIRKRVAEDSSDLGPRLVHIFQILNTQEDGRQSRLDEELASLPYVNGKLFEESIATPSFSGTMRYDLIEAMKLDWSKVSPAIFGSMFQGVMDEEQRRNLGAHYTSEANILKVIKPLLLDDLYDEFRRAAKAGPKKKYDELRKLQDKIAGLKFLDPACGCGNFLVIAYRELRRLEHKILARLAENPNQLGMIVGPDASPIKVNVDQMYGIEIEEFPSLVAQTALWLTDHQMNMEYSSQAAKAFKRIPLTSSPKIVNANALTKDWSEVVSPKELDYILGNPPFVGSKMMMPAMRQKLLEQFPDVKGAGVLDYVSAWYAKATATMKQNSAIRSALVSTNSITQGEQVPILWRYLFKQKVLIDFAHQTFKWSNEAKGNAAVYCVIVGFSMSGKGQKRIYEYEDVKGEPTEVKAETINAYLVDAPNVFIQRRGKPLSAVPPMQFGNMPLDGGNLLLTDQEKDRLVTKEPRAEKYIKRLISARELLQGGSRWCLWLLGVEPGELRRLPEVFKRVKKVREFRLASPTSSTNDHSARPAEFRDTANPERYIVVPRVSSEKREYVPMSFFSGGEIVGDTCQLVPDATLWHFGILTSRMHMAWMRVVGGRLKSDYRYSKDIVYNNFIWPDIDDSQKDKVAELAKAVLDARTLYPESTLADLYDPNTMPLSLRKAHNKLDKFVDEFYGLAPDSTDAERVGRLFGLYQVATSEA